MNPNPSSPLHPTRRAFHRAAAAMLALPFMRPAAAVAAARRSALVIGNANYTVAPLRNPINDARLMAGTLRQLGYRVDLIEDARLAPMSDGIRDWLTSARDAEQRFFYFAGHGAQYRGRNYLLPIDAELQTEDEVQQRAVSSTDLAERLARIPEGVNVLVLDACRSTPYPLTVAAAGARSRATVGSMPAGLSSALPAQGTLIAYATAPGAVALDGKDTPTSAYTRNLAAQMTVPDVPVETVFKRVRAAVAKETGNRQVPWETSSLVGDFCFAQSQGGRCSVAAAQGGSIDLGRIKQ